MHVIIRSRLYLKHAETLPLYQWSGSILTFFPITMVQNMNNQESRHKYWATRSSIRSFARITHSFACLLAHSLPSLWGNKMIQWLFLLIFSVLDHSTTRPRLSLVSACAHVPARALACAHARKRTKYLQLHFMADVCIPFVISSYG